MGLYRSNGVYCTQCEAEGFRRITYFLDRPDILSVYTVRIEADASEAPLLLSNGNPVEAGELAGRPALCRLARSASRSRPTCSRWSPAISACVKDSFVTASGRKVELGIYVEHGKEQLAAYAMDALKRSMTLGRGGVRPRIRSRRLQHRRRVRLQHGRDGEQGPQRLQRQIRAGRRRDRDRRRLRQYRGDHRA